MSLSLAAAVFIMSQVVVKAETTTVAVMGDVLSFSGLRSNRDNSFDTAAKTQCAGDGPSSPFVSSLQCHLEGEQHQDVWAPRWGIEQQAYY